MKATRNNRDKIPGSPKPGEPEYVLIGRLQRAHGVGGEIVLGLATDFPERIKPGKQIFLGNRHTPIRITGTRPFHDNLLITLEGIRNREDAAVLTNLEVFVQVKDLPALENGLYYHHQLIGLTVKDEGGTTLGTIREILETGANDVYVVISPDGEEILLPAVDPVIQNVDIENKSIVVRPPEWE